MDQPASNMEYGKAQDPEDKKNHRYCPDHDSTPICICFAFLTNEGVGRFRYDNTEWFCTSRANKPSGTRP